MSGPRAVGWLLGAGVIIMISLATVTGRRYSSPFPPLSISLSSEVTPLSDFAGISLGFRKLTADIAWVQMLIYYGTDEAATPWKEVENGGGRYPLFLAYCQRVARIDPYFKHIFYYGGAVLGWNLNRLDEAETLLKEGIQANPKEWRFQQFLAGLAFQKNHNVNKLSEFLQGFVDQDDCPNLLRSILANIYKKQKQYKKAIEVWTIVYNTQDPIYLKRAESQINELSSMEAEIGRKAH